MRGGSTKKFASPIIFNGKFLSAAPTGVHRVAKEMILAIDEVLSADSSVYKDLFFVVAKPRNTKSEVYPKKISIVTVGHLVGQFWEQISLPWFAKHSILINLCNLAPIAQPGIVMIHDAQVHIIPQSYSKPFVAFYMAVQPLITKRAKLVITVSNYSRTMLIKYGVASAEKIKVIYNGVDHMLRVEPDQKILSVLGLKNGAYVVALANTQVHKNIRVLMKAFEDPLLSNAKLVLVGAATAKDFLAEGHACLPSAVFGGRVTDEELRALLEGAACLAFPSTTEGFGLPPLEAMILGCPAIVAPCGALPEICGSAVTYAPADDPDAWAVAIANLISNPKVRAEEGERGRLHATSFTWARSARQLLDVLNEIMAVKPHPKRV